MIFSLEKDNFLMHLISIHVFIFFFKKHLLLDILLFQYFSNVTYGEGINVSKIPFLVSFLLLNTSSPFKSYMAYQLDTFKDESKTKNISFVDGKGTVVNMIDISNPTGGKILSSCCYPLKCVKTWEQKSLAGTCYHKKWEHLLNLLKESA